MAWCTGTGEANSRTRAAKARISARADLDSDEAWESEERDKLSGAGLSTDAVYRRPPPKPELNSSGGGSDMGKA